MLYNPTIYYKIQDNEPSFERSMRIEGWLSFNKDGLYDFEIERVAHQIAEKEYYDSDTGGFDDVSILILRAVGDEEITINKTVEVEVEFDVPQFYPEILDES